MVILLHRDCLIVHGTLTCLVVSIRVGSRSLLLEDLEGLVLPDWLQGLMVLVHLRLGYLRLNPFMINVYNTVSQVVAVPVIFAFALYSKL